MMLQRRVTHKYVGSYQHEDEWENVGEFTILSTQKWKIVEEEDEFDPTEPLKVVHTLLVVPNEEATLEDISIALKDTFTQVGCHHEYDCCGCRSYYAGKPDYSFADEDGLHYELTISSYRNY
jgi:hypothetical protein